MTASRQLLEIKILIKIYLLKRKAEVSRNVTLFTNKMK